MAVQDRFSALQNEPVRLNHIFESNGNLIELNELPTITILDSDGVTTLDTLTATMQSPGIYYADYDVPISLATGQYYDKWTYRYATDDSFLDVITHFQVHPKDSILNFSSSTISQKYSDLMERAIRDLANWFIYEAMHIPVYGEQAMRTGDNSRYNFAFKNWTMDPRPVVRVNNRVVIDGWYADYQGNIFFETPLDGSDVVYAHYNFAYFSKEELAGFIDTGLGAMNSIPPPTSQYTDVANTPVEWWHGIQVYAAMQALRRLLLGLSFQETALIFGTGDNASSAREIVRGLYDSYSDIWKEIAAGIKKRLPGIGQVIIPEYTLPGGRARWYRYLFVSGV